MEIIARSLPGHFIMLLLFLLTFILLSLSSICIDDSNAVTEHQQTSRGQPVVIVPGLMDNVLTLVSFLFLGCFFVLGLRIQSAERTTRGSASQSSSPTSSSSLIDKYFLLLILVSLIPAIIVIIYGIVLIGMYLFGTINTPSGKSAYLQGNVSYLLLLFICFIPAGAVLFFIKKLHIGTSRDKP